MKSLTSVFKKVSGGAQNIFKKGQEVGENIMKKGPGIASRISEGALDASNILGKVSKISQKIAASPITSAVPVVGPGLASLASGVSVGSKMAQRGTKQLSELSNPLNYKPVRGVGSGLENVRDIQRRTSEIADTGREVQSMFA